MIKLLKRHFGACVRVRFTGLNIGRVLNIALENNIELENIRRTEYACIEADISRGELKKLKGLINRDSVRTDELKHGGLAYVVMTAGHRYALWAGVILSVISLTLLSQRTWFVRVHGCDDAEDIVRAVKESGMLDWHFRLDGRIENAQAAVSACDNDVLWSSVSYKGAKVDVYVKKNTGKLQSDDGDSHNIVAAKDCVIRNLIVTDGTAAAVNGQTVSKGQTLIEGSITLGETVYPVTASGQALASVWYCAGTDITPETTYESTGREIKKRTVEIFGMKFATGEKNTFEDFTVSEKEVYCGALPIRVIDTVYVETIPVKKTFDREKVVREAEKALTASLMIPENARICEQKTTVTDTDTGIRVSVYVETVEDVAERG